MTARLDIGKVRAAADSFPNGAGWRWLPCCEFGRPPGQPRWDWGPTGDLSRVGGVYAVMLPARLFTRPRTIHLHGPNKVQIPFEFTVTALPGSQLGVVYAGRTTALAERFRGHLLPGKRKDGGQVKFGLMDCGLCHSEDDARSLLHREATIVGLPLPGPKETVNRDLLELTLCARFCPPFNLKSER